MKEGLEEVEKAILLDPQEWDAYFWKGMLLAYYRGQSHAEEAVRSAGTDGVGSCCVAAYAVLCLVDRDAASPMR